MRLILCFYTFVTDYCKPTDAYRYLLTYLTANLGKSLLLKKILRCVRCLCVCVHVNQSICVCVPVCPFVHIFLFTAIVFCSEECICARFNGTCCHGL